MLAANDLFNWHYQWNWPAAGGAVVLGLASCYLWFKVSRAMARLRTATDATTAAAQRLLEAGKAVTRYCEEAAEDRILAQPRRVVFIRADVFDGAAGLPGSVVVQVENLSADYIYDVNGYYLFGDGEEMPKYFRLTALGPGIRSEHYFTVEPEYPYPEDRRFELHFTDARGLRWARRPGEASPRQIVAEQR